VLAAQVTFDHHFPGNDPATVGWAYGEFAF
jgi:hypothetical protein